MKKDDIIVRNIDYFTPNGGIENFYLQIQVFKVGCAFVILKENPHQMDENEILYTGKNIFDTALMWKKVSLDNGRKI